MTALHNKSPDALAGAPGLDFFHQRHRQVGIDDAAYAEPISRATN